MTPFEQAEKNIQDLAVKLNLYDLLIQTVQDTEDLTEEEADNIWQIIVAMIEASQMVEHDS
jgi:hypothetical protein